MTSGSGQPDKMAEVAGLAAAIADRILEQHEAGTPIPPEQFRMLVKAAQMLLDNDVPWPPSVAYVILEVARRVEEAQPVSRGGDVVVHLKQSPKATSEI